MDSRNRTGTYPSSVEEAPRNDLASVLPGTFRQAARPSQQGLALGQLGHRGKKEDEMAAENVARCETAIASPRLQHLYRSLWVLGENCAAPP